MYPLSPPQTKAIGISLFYRNLDLLSFACESAYMFSKNVLQ
ncbi:hypothetical protein B4168_0557 [Anoxybacillus flavithermus]|nr:hypothetical protein B4168_0557 [Anoxybacillus flavithermus]OAO86567.1 hypothetical protein GT23_1585 [Parageobacillus thermoglucosidasius]